MKNKQIINKLSALHKPSFSFENFLTEIHTIKNKYVLKNNQEQAKLLWCYQAIVEIHKNFNHAFILLKDKKYYKAWCQLEQIEISFKWLKRHFIYNKDEYYLLHIEKSVKNLQILYPYRLFGSSELIKKKKKCSVCNKEILLRNPCGHVVGEIYDGEMCHRIVTEAEVLGLSVVENPGNKYSVMFTIDPKTNEKVDHYNYDSVDYLLKVIDSPYEKWNLEVMTKYHPHENYKDIGRNDKCPCNSRLKYKKCCLKEKGIKYPHYEFIVKNPIKDELLITQ